MQIPISVAQGWLSGGARTTHVYIHISVCRLNEYDALLLHGRSKCGQIKTT